ncbi:MAG TPA: cobalamin-binding protein [Bryobacteraceae bacterium]|jgi:iron complex transport system substrate-binding protein|nr:cobalamin-binding protein [Bryobacteraceae bacterium]
MNPSGFPRRIVCLTEESTEVLYLLGEEAKIVGVSGFTARPPEARQKPKVSAFTTAKFDRIVQLDPDLIIGFSDLQADIARELIARGRNVLVFNQRSVSEILEMIAALARIVGAESRGLALVERLQGELAAIARSAQRFPRRPRVFFEEWSDPLISGIRWVDELIEIAGGTPLFPELRCRQDAKGRIVEAAAVRERDPEIVIASWCGKKVNKQTIRSREGWERIHHVYEIKSTYILQPGPAALTEGARQLHAILARVAGCPVPPELRPAEKIDPDLETG